MCTDQLFEKLSLLKYINVSIIFFNTAIQVIMHLARFQCLFARFQFEIIQIDCHLICVKNDNVRQNDINTLMLLSCDNVFFVMLVKIFSPQLQHSDTHNMDLIKLANNFGRFMMSCTLEHDTTGILWFK